MTRYYTEARPKATTHTPGPMKLTEIASRINAHLKRFEADPKINKKNLTYGTTPYYYAGARRAGAYVNVWYVSYQGGLNLTRSEAERYLAALDKGFVGLHFEALP